jgi:hypothetical protein
MLKDPVFLIRYFLVRLRIRILFFNGFQDANENDFVYLFCLLFTVGTVSHQEVTKL